MIRLVPLLALLWPSAALANARLVEMAGDVRLQDPRGHTSPASIDAELAAGTIVVTGERSTASLRLADGSLLVLGERSRLRLTRMLVDPARRAREMALMLEVGELLSQVVEMLGVDSLFEVRTPRDRVRVRSGEFLLSVGPDGETRIEVRTAVGVETGETASSAGAPGGRAGAAPSTSRPPAVAARRDPLTLPANEAVRELLRGTPAEGLTTGVPVPALDDLIGGLAQRAGRTAARLVPSVPLLGTRGEGARLRGRVEFR